MNGWNVLAAVGAILFAYLIGSINFAVIFSKIFLGKDLREMGSGNAGATNMLRTGGLLPGALTFLCDALKGFVACLAGKLVFTSLFDLTGHLAFTPIYGAYLCCVAVMLGHIFPIFFGFKGGKAVACSVGSFTVCCPLAIAVGLAVFVLSLLISRIVSISSLIATVVVVSLSIALTDPSPASRLPIVLLALVAGAIVFIKHKDNIGRLIKGTEKKISLGKGKKHG